MKRSTLVLIAFIVALILFSGCSDPIRFGPTEAQKQTAQMGVDATGYIEQNGTPPGSDISKIARDSAKTTQIYFGLPKEPLADPAVMIPQAKADAVKRPDPWDTADMLLNTGIGIAGLFGGVWSIKAAKFITAAQAKSKALREIVKAQQKFRDELKRNANSDETIAASEVLKSLKDANVIQSPETEVLVTEIKSKAKKDAA